MIAEFMLHRTKAEQVKPVYREFIKKYPTVFSLSEAKKSDVKNVTKHLGLHWRADHFIKAAKFIVKNFGGRFPKKPENLLEIPGVGEYIAGAILTVCFRKNYPVVDSNIARYINRFFGLNLNGEIRRKKEIVNIAGELFKVKDPGRLLFAIIDFTSLVCKPISPDCINCIFKKRCYYYENSSKM
jgi:A/G-specific adenine glycosylase